MVNHWEIKGFCYWEKEISLDGDFIWVNVGWHTPLIFSNKTKLSKMLAISGEFYSKKFN